MARKPTPTNKTPTPPGGVVRVAIYLRISTDEDNQPYSLEAQEHRLMPFIASQPGWEHSATYTDQMSGAYAERPGLDQALRDARLGAFDILLVYRVDRFARSLKVLVWLLEELDSAGVAFRSATEPIDTTTATGRMLVQLLGVFAEFERATIIDRVIAGMERKAARGGWTAGRRPYGLTVERDSTGQVANEGRPVVEPAEMPVVERIFARYAEGQEGAVAIAAELNADGLCTRSGRQWSAKVILGILRNRVYVGEVFFRGSWHRSTEPFIDPALFDQVQQILDRRGEGYTARNTDTHPEYLLSGLITCERCGRRYIGAAARGKRHRYRYYVCWSRSRYGTAACSGERIRADALEAAVFDALVEFYAHPDALAGVLAEGRQQSAAAARQQDTSRRRRRGQAHRGRRRALHARLREWRAC